MKIFSHALNVSLLQKALSQARITSYATLVGDPSVEAGIGAYVWGLELTSALFPLLSTVEVALRNSIHEAATLKIGKPNWYQDVLKNNGDRIWGKKVASDPTITQTYYRQGVPPYNKKKIWIGGAQKSLKHWRSSAEAKLEEIFTRLTQDGKAHTPDQVVANTMFGFWLTLLGPSFEDATDPLALWPQCTSDTFPNDATMTRSRAHGLLQNIKALRNRVSHHEPAWRISALLTPAGVHTAIQTHAREIQELLEAISPDIWGLLENTGAMSRLNWLLDPQTVASFAGKETLRQIDSRALIRTVRKLATNTKRRILTTTTPVPTKAVVVEVSGKTILTVLPHG